MDLERAQAAFESGLLSEVVIEPSDQGGGWMVLLCDTKGQRHSLTDHTGTEKIYHDLDVATLTAKEIGFDKIRVEEPF